MSQTDPHWFRRPNTLVFVIVDHSHSADQLLDRKFWVSKDAAERVAQNVREVKGCPAPAIEVIELSFEV